MAPKSKNEPDVDETNIDDAAEQTEELDSLDDAPAAEATEESDVALEEIEPEPPHVAFELAGDVTAFRHTVGGNEISLDEGDQYLTNDAREIAQLDAHDAVRRCEEPA